MVAAFGARLAGSGSQLTGAVQGITYSQKKVNMYKPFYRFLVKLSMGLLLDAFNRAGYVAEFVTVHIMSLCRHFPTSCMSAMCVIDTLSRATKFGSPRF